MSCNRKAEVRSTRSGRLRLTMRGPPWVTELNRSRGSAPRAGWWVSP